MMKDGDYESDFDGRLQVKHREEKGDIKASADAHVKGPGQILEEETMFKERDGRGQNKERDGRGQKMEDLVKQSYWAGEIICDAAQSSSCKAFSSVCLPSATDPTTKKTIY